MATYDYDDFRVTLTPRPDGAYETRAVGPDGTVYAALFRMPLTDEQFEQSVLAVARRGPAATGTATRDVGGGGRPTLVAEELGGALADALLTGEVGTGYETARWRAAEAGRGLRLTLSLAAAPQLLSVPWELLYRRPRFLANQRHTPLVRQLDTAGFPVPPAIDTTVRILGVIASPADCAPLDVAAERARVERAVAEMAAMGRIRLDWLEPATPRRLREALRDGSYHVLHYVGHSDFTVDGQGVLYLEGADGVHADVDSTELANLLADQTSLRLVVLNSCEGARTTLTDPYAGVATTLVQLGVPAVVAMQFEISDAAAILFADELYTNLIGRQDPIDAAVAEARKAIYIELGTVEWATPVLFMGDVNADLFRFAIAAAPLPPPPPPSSLPAIEERPAVLSAPAAPVPRRSGRGRAAILGVVALLAIGAAVGAGALRRWLDDAGGTDDTGRSGSSGPVTAGASDTVAAAEAPQTGPTAAPLDAPVPLGGVIGTPGGSAHHAVDLAAGQIIYVSALEACGADLVYELLAPSGSNELGYPRRVCDDGGRVQVAEGGRHTLRVSGRGSATGAYSFEIGPVRADRMATLAVGDAAVGAIDQIGAHDVYTLRPAMGDLVYIDARGACGAELTSALRSPSDQVLLGYDHRACDDGGRQLITEIGDHTLTVYGEQRATGAYDIAVLPIRPDRREPITVGQRAAGTIDGPGAHDVFVFDGRAGDVVFLEASGPCGADLFYEFTSPSGAQLLGFPFRTCDPGRVELTENGQHTLLVYGREAATGPYDIGLVAG